MALPPDKTDPSADRNRNRAQQEGTFVREVDDALRKDQMEGFFKRYGFHVLAALILGLAGLGGFLWWEHSQKVSAGERSEEYLVALDQLDAGNLQGAYDKLGPVVEADGTASAVAAQLLRAGLSVELNKPEEAAKLYTQVADDSKVPQAFRDLAAVRLVALRYDEMKPQDVIDRLKSLAVPGNAWFGVAGELVGMAYLEQDKKDLAGPLFASIARDKDVPETLRGRARQLAGLLGADALDDVVGDGAGDATDGAASGPAPAPAQ